MKIKLNLQIDCDSKIQKSFEFGTDSFKKICSVTRNFLNNTAASGNEKSTFTAGSCNIYQDVFNVFEKFSKINPDDFKKFLSTMGALFPKFDVEYFKRMNQMIPPNIADFYKDIYNAYEKFFNMGSDENKKKI